MGIDVLLVSDSALARVRWPAMILDDESLRRVLLRAAFKALIDWLTLFFRLWVVPPS